MAGSAVLSFGGTGALGILEPSAGVSRLSQPSSSPTFHRIVRGSPHHASSSESSPPRQRRGGGEHGGTAVAQQESRGLRVSCPKPHRERRQAGGRAGGEQADPPGCIAVEDRARQEER